VTIRLTVAVDFDGVLHPYTDGYTGPIPADEPPSPGAHLFLEDLTDQGYRVVVYSARAASVVGKRAIHDWLLKHGLARHVSDISSFKPVAVAYVDDRAVRFDGDFARCALEVQRLAEKGHNEPR